MYAKCGAFVKAKAVLRGLSAQNAVLWNALIAGYVQRKYSQEALDCYEQMQCAGLSPDVVTYVCILKACGSIGTLAKGEQIHSEIVRQGLLHGNAILGGALVDMYSKCGALEKAKEVLKRLPVQDAISWNALITGYVQKGFFKEALDFFEQMQQQGFSPDAVTYICILKACGTTGALDTGGSIHSEIIRQGLLIENVAVGNALVDMYAKCGLLSKAKEVLEGLPVQDVVSWSTLIAGYAHGEHGNEALNCFDKMHQEGFFPDAGTFMCALKACGIVRAFDKGQDIHFEVVRQGLLAGNVELCCALVDMYAKCGALGKAQEVLKEYAGQDVASWNALIAGYAQGDYGKAALSCFEQMQCEGICPNSITFISSLKACGVIGALDRGESIYSDIIRHGLLDGNLPLGNALVDMYAKCGALLKAKEVLEGLPARDVVSWSVLIAGYTQRGYGKESLECFGRMQQEGISPNAVTFICILKACGIIKALNKGEILHHQIVRQGLLNGNATLCNALVDMYAKCGVIEKAKSLLEEFPIRNVACWSALISGYAQGGYGKEALDCFERMQHEGLFPNAVTFICILNACGSTGALGKGEAIHFEIARQGLLSTNVVLGGALIDMYAKCGALNKAKEVLDGLPERNVASWNALISGYAQGELSKDALDCFERMQYEGLAPDEITFLCVLSACCHSGLLHEGQMYFTRMGRDYAIVPDSDHHTCMVNLFCCVGLLDNAVAVMEKIRTPTDPSLWLGMLGACRRWGDAGLGKWALQHVN